jgi:hypothetical protein
MTLSRPKYSFQNKNEFISISPRTAVPVKLMSLRFIKLCLKDADKTMRDISPFYTQKTLDRIAGKVKNSSCLKNGTLLEEERNDEQAELPLKATLLV